MDGQALMRIMMMVSIGGLVLGAVYLLWRIIDRIRHGRRHTSRGAASVASQRTSSTRWARPHDVRDLILPKGVERDPRRCRLGLLGKHEVVNPPRRSKMVIAPTGAGKTPRVLVPDVLLHRGPAVVTGTKPDVLQLTMRHRASQGPVWVLDPLESGGRSARWSVLWSIHDWGDAIDAAGWLAEAAAADARGVENADFWDSNARQMLAPMLLWAAKTDRTMADLTSAIANLSEMEELINAELMDLPGADGAVDDWRYFRTQIHPKTKSSVIATGRTLLEAWRHPRAQKVIGVRAGEEDPTILDVNQLIDQQGTLYLVCPPAEQKQMSCLFEALINAILINVERRFHATGRPLDPPLLLGLDEAANIAPLRKLDEIASEKAAYGIILISVWQNDSQVITCYGPDRARTIRANHSARVYLSGIADLETLENLSKTIGSDVLELASSSRDYDPTRIGPGRVNVSTNYQTFEVAPVDELRQLPDDTAIVITRNFKPMKLRIPGWFDTPELRALVDPDAAAYFDAEFAPVTGRRGKKRQAATAHRETAALSRGPRSGDEDLPQLPSACEDDEFARMLEDSRRDQ